MAKVSICRNCFHSYVCEQFNENKDDNNEKCHFLNDHYVPIADVVPKSEVEKIEKESSAFAEIIHKQEDEIQQLRKSLLTKQALEEEFSKSVKKIEKQALKTIENAKQEVAREIFEEIERTLPNEFPFLGTAVAVYLAELKKKYTESEDTK